MRLQAMFRGEDETACPRTFPCGDAGTCIIDLRRGR
jgi:hypothetical protein